jgi:hypothetical protein
MSATLKIAGKPHTWMKSTTCPCPNEGGRNSRSVTLPKAPPRTRPNMTAHPIERIRGANQMMNTITPTAMIESTQVNPVANENAAPAFRT